MLKFWLYVAFLVLFTGRIPEVMAFFATGKISTEPIRLTNNRDFLQHLSWSPDGKQFLVTRIHGGKMGLWTLEATGGDLKRLLPDNAEPHFDGHWSSDSKKIVFVYDKLQGTDGKLQIDVINADGSEHKNLLPHKAFDESPRWSPDGKRIAWASTRDKNQDIWICDADGKNQKVYVLDRASLEILTSFGDGGRQPGQFFAVHSIATDSKGNLFTTETYEGRRLQKFVYRGLGPVTKMDQGTVWPAK